MAGCTVKSTSYGYKCGGADHDNTLVSAGKLRIQSLLYFPATGANSCAITDGVGNTIMTIKGSATAAYETQIWMDATVEGMYVDLAEANDRLLIFIQ